jgi:hypothetical protein
MIEKTARVDRSRFSSKRASAGIDGVVSMAAGGGLVLDLGTIHLAQAIIEEFYLLEELGMGVFDTQGSQITKPDEYAHCVNNGLPLRFIPYYSKYF